MHGVLSCGHTAYTHQSLDSRHLVHPRKPRTRLRLLHIRLSHDMAQVKHTTSTSRHHSVKSYLSLLTSTASLKTLRLYFSIVDSRCTSFVNCSSAPQHCPSMSPSTPCRQDSSSHPESILSECWLTLFGDLSLVHLALNCAQDTHMP